MEREKAEELMGRKWREKALFGECHFWVGFEAKRAEPREILAALMEEKKMVKRKGQINNSRVLGIMLSLFSLSLS